MVYYLSAEFLMGRTLTNAIYNLGLEGEYKEALQKLGYSLEQLQARLLLSISLSEDGGQCCCRHLNIGWDSRVMLCLKRHALCLRSDTLGNTMPFIVKPV